MRRKRRVEERGKRNGNIGSSRKEKKMGSENKEWKQKWILEKSGGERGNCEEEKSREDKWRREWKKEGKERRGRGQKGGDEKSLRKWEERGREK